jgi:hypothetical protein
MLLCTQLTKPRLDPPCGATRPHRPPFLVRHLLAFAASPSNLVTGFGARVIVDRSSRPVIHSRSELMTSGPAGYCEQPATVPSMSQDCSRRVTNLVRPLLNLTSTFVRPFPLASGYEATLHRGKVRGQGFPPLCPYTDNHARRRGARRHFLRFVKPLTHLYESYATQMRLLCNRTFRRPGAGAGAAPRKR